jgi:hypothetical protein
VNLKTTLRDLITFASIGNMGRIRKGFSLSLQQKEVECVLLIEFLCTVAVMWTALSHRLAVIVGTFLS